MTRLPVTKTPKVYVGGAFIRSESGRVAPLQDAAGNFVAQIPQCTRKDLRNAVEAAAKAGPAWAKRTPYNRGQILYRLAEMLEGRAGEMAEALVLDGTAPLKAAQSEVAAACDRLVYFAGWADKFEQVLGNTNPVATPHFNFTVCEPMGVVGVIAGDAAPLLGLISQLAPIIVSGNTAVAHASEKHPYSAILLGEILAVSDLPGGVVNLLTGRRKELLPTFATHTHLRAIDAVVTDADERKTLGLGAAESVKRIKYRDAASADAASPHKAAWSDASVHESVYAIRDFIEFKTTWHPIGA
jgi:acyl-CoA reductase-like NAD-dependent aldehyde dehydrogenase